MSDLGIDDQRSKTQWYHRAREAKDASLQDLSIVNPNSDTPGNTHGIPIQNYVTNKMELAKRTQAAIKMTTQLASFVPDYVLTNDFPKITYDTKIDAVVLVADVSGFTALTEAYSLRGKGGTEQLTKTLSSYMSPLAECILHAGGDIIKYAGDAFLAVWRIYDRKFTTTMVRVVDCALYIQESYGSFFCADVEITIRVKIGIGAGTAYECVIGNPEYHHFVTFGMGVEDASDAEHHCEKGDVILSPSAWSHVNAADFNYILRDHNYVKVTELVNFPPGELRGRPVVEKGKTVRIKELRPCVPAAIERKSDQQLRPYVITPVHKILDGNMPLDYLNESRQTSICFIKLELKRFDPKATFVDSMLQIVQRAFKHIYDAAKLTGGSLTKIIMFDKGLTYLVVFGLPGYLHSNQSANALEFSHRVKGQILHIKGVEEVSLGVTTGASYCGILGHPKRQEYTVIGQMVNKAARLMCNYVGIVSCDQDTLFHSKRPIHHFSVLPQKTLKGISAAGNIYEYLGAEQGQDQTVKTFDYPMINRESELKFFKAILESAEMEFMRYLQAHRIQGDYDARMTKDVVATGLWMLVVEGDVGLGKSRLLSAFVQEAEEREVFVAFSLTMTMILKEPLGGIRTLLYPAFGLEGMVSAVEKEEHLRRLSGDDADLLTGLCLLNELLNLKFPLHAKYQSADLTTRHIYSQHIVAALFRRIFTEKLLLLVVDDAHLMDPKSWDYLFYLSRSPHVVVVLSILRTPSGAPKLDSSIFNIIYRQKNVKTLRLTAMDIGYSVPLACQMMEVIAIPQELERILVQKSKGNPAWIDQVLKEMLRTGLLKIMTLNVREAGKRKLKLTTVNEKYIRRIVVERQKGPGGWRSEPPSKIASTESLASIAPNASTSRLDPHTGRRAQKVTENPETRMCVVKSDTNLGSAPIPGTLKEILLDMFDELNSNEQLLLKCAAVLGFRFSRVMLICLIPLYEVNASKYENGFKRLMEGKVIRCASIPHTHARHNEFNEESGKGSIDCHCRFTREEVGNLQQLESIEAARMGSRRKGFQPYLGCKFMQFTKESMLEVVYELLTEDQRKELHLRAAKYYDTSIIRCGIHGGDDTAYQFGFTVKGSADVGADHEEALRQAAGRGRRMSFYAATQAAMHKIPLKADAGGGEDAQASQNANSGTPRKHDIHKADSHRKKLRASGGGKIAGYDEFNILTEMEKLEVKRHPKARRCHMCVRKSKPTGMEPAEYELEIKKLVAQDKGGGDDISEDDASIKSSAAVIGTQSKAKEVVVDLRGCACTNIQAKVCVEMVKHYRQAEKYGKCLVNLLDAGECAVTIGNSGQALVHLEDAIALVTAVKNKELPEPLAEDPDDLVIDDEEVAIQVEFLYGLSYFELGIHLKAREFFLRSLKRFGMEIPGYDDKVKINSQTMRLNSRLWQRHNIGCRSSCCKDRLNDEAEVDPLVTLKLRILTYLQVLFKVDRKFDMVMLVSLWQVLTAEDGSGQYQDILPAYCTMMETYSLMSDHNKAGLYEKLALKVIRKTFERLESPMPPLGLYSVSQVFCTVGFIRFLRGEINQATDAAYLSLRIARTMHDNAIALFVYPRLVLSLLMSLRVSEVVEVLQKLWYTAEEEEDWNGTALYWTLCLALLLNTAYPVEPYSACEHFVANCDWGADVQLFRMYEIQFNMESSIALWNTRYSRWDLALKWIDMAVKAKPKYTNYFTVDGQLKLLECELIFVNHYLETKRYQHFAKARNTAKSLMISLETNTKRIPVLLPRFLHLMAYYCRIRSRHGDAEKHLHKAEIIAASHGNTLEMEWIAHNRTVWAELAIPTIKYFWLEHTESNPLDWHQSSKVPWSNIMYSLPLPTWG